MAFDAVYKSLPMSDAPAPIAKRLASLNRFRQIVQALVRHGLYGLVDQLGLADRALVAVPQKGEKTAARFGRRLSLALNDLGPTFVKLGQILSTREDMFPKATVQELKQLQDNAGPVPIRAVRAAIEKELGAPVEELFQEFSDVPMAAASIAQVHRARTHRGEEVVVKVRRPGIEKTIAKDIELLLSLAEMAAKRVADIGRHDPVGFVVEFGEALTQELDFHKEAQTLGRMSTALRGTAHVPAVIGDRSSKGVLTLEYVAGRKITEVSGKARQAAARHVVTCFVTQLLRSNLFHADPHAGNLMWRPVGDLALLDLGSVGHLDGRMRRTLGRLSAAALRRDGRRFAQVLLHMAHHPPEFDKGAYLNEVGAFLSEVLADPVTKADPQLLVAHAFDVTRRYELRMRSEYFLLLRSLLLVDGVVRTLDPQLDPLKVVRAHIVRYFWTPTWFLPATRIAWVAGRLKLNAAARRRPLLTAVGSIALAVGIGLGVAGGVSLPSGAGTRHTADAAPTQDVKAEDDRATATARKSCPLFVKPNRRSNRLAVLPAGSRMQVQGSTRYFWRVATPSGTVGYVLRSCVKAPKGI